jgi:16S rRNA (cytidine1402-2'-O)-methyltransferase
LLLFPTDLAAGTTQAWAGARFRETLGKVRHFAVEHPKTARQFLKALGLPLAELKLEVLDVNSGPGDVRRLAAILHEHDLGLLSEAGSPAVADPGALLVAEAHRLGVPVVPLVGPSSIIMALMASGLEGQRFAFNGYLPQRSPEREQAIRQLEERSARLVQTEIFIEAPYRNNALLAALLGTCKPSTRLCLATEITAPGETIRTQAVADWSRQPPNLDRRPTVFLFLAGRTSAQGRGRGGGSH